MGSVFYGRGTHWHKDQWSSWHELSNKKGVKQGDSLSPILFNIVVDILAILINRAKGEGQILRVIPHLVDEGLSILQYADDTILFMEHNLEQVKKYEASSKCFW
jgi:hypothetical protein